MPITDNGGLLRPGPKPTGAFPVLQLGKISETLCMEKGYVVVGFNHPKPDQYNDWDHIDPEIVKLISTFEMHTRYNEIRWEAYIRA